MWRGTEEDSGGGGGKAEDGGGGGGGEDWTKSAAGGREVHEVFDVMEMLGESEEKLVRKRQEAGWVGHGSSAW